MDFFFCLPILIGCQTKVKPDGDPTARICPRCHNAAVQAAKARTWFEFCFVPVVPFKSKHVWICAICQWQLKIQPGWEPQAVGNQPFFPPQGAFSPMNPSGYQPNYIQAYPPAAGPSGHPPATFDPGRKHN